MTLDVGCGRKKQEPGAVGLDRQPGSAADILCELAHFPWPLHESCAHWIHLSHFIEHQPDALRVMREVHRIAAPGAEVIVTTPHYSSPDSYADPTHILHLGLRAFDYFLGDTFANFTYNAGGGSAFWSGGSLSEATCFSTIWDDCSPPFRRASTKNTSPGCFRPATSSAGCKW